uniref:alginate lyase family protein n=1 Tax=Exiguobacterium alkaliphilum TaxID=1428684 RepID=UPI0005593524
NVNENFSFPNFFYEDNSFGDIEQNILIDANKIIQGKRCILNNIFDTNLSEWKKDLSSGKVYPDKFYKRIKVVDLKDNSDVKYVWEQSRLQHIPTLGRAYFFKKDPVYLKYFIDELMDWIEQNPYKKGVNWTSAMEVAIRSLNIITGLIYFNNYNCLPNKEKKIIEKSLYEHGEFIYGNLENSNGITGNHYMSNIMGLIWISLYFDREDSKVSKWISLGISEFKKEIKTQYFDDGSNYEGAPAYHKLTSEMVFLTMIMLKENNMNLDDSYWHDMKMNINYLISMTKDDGLLPLFGDNDSGRILIFSDYFSMDKHLTSKIITPYYYELGLRISPCRKYFYKDEENNESRIYFSDSINNFFEKGGYYNLKCNDFCIYIRCGQLSFGGLGVHSHNDQLSFELTYRGKNFFVDAGTYHYTKNVQMRSKDKTTSVHNTLFLKEDDKVIEQNNFNEIYLFELKEKTNSLCKYYDERTFEGEHYGYKDIGRIHSRKFEVNNEKKMLKIYDELKRVETKISNIKYHPNLNFLLHPNVEVEIVNNYSLNLKNGNETLNISSSKQKLILNKATYSKAYGIIEDTYAINISGFLENHTLQITAL